MIEIPVTYMCMGCGSVVVVYEECDEPLPSKEVWNLCSLCIEKARNNG